MIEVRVGDHDGVDGARLDPGVAQSGGQLAGARDRAGHASVDEDELRTGAR